MPKMPLTYEDAVSRIAELEVQLADIKSQFRREKDAIYKDGISEGGRICKAVAERAVQKVRIDTTLKVMAEQNKIRDEAIEVNVKQAMREERQRIMAILKTAYPAIDTWPCWADIRG